MKLIEQNNFEEFEKLSRTEQEKILMALARQPGNRGLYFITQYTLWKLNQLKNDTKI